MDQNETAKTAEINKEKKQLSNQINKRENTLKLYEIELEKQKAELNKTQEQLQEKQKEESKIRDNRNNLEHLRKQLEMVQVDLKNSYERYSKSLDPDFLKKREINFIQNKLNNLKTERDNILKKLKNEYKVRTRCNNIVYKLNQTNNEYINNLNNNINDNKNSINNVEQKIQHKDRLVSINKYNVKSIDRQINIVMTILFVIILGLIPTILAFINVIPAKLAFISLLVFIIVGGIIITFKFKTVRNRSNRIWEMKNFNDPDFKKKTVKDEIILSEDEEDEEDKEPEETLEDIYAAKLNDVKKCPTNITK